MENNTEKKEFEFSLVSFLEIFKGKLKMLVAIGLVAAILGGAIGEIYAEKIKKIDPNYEIPKKAGCISFAGKKN